MFRPIRLKCSGSIFNHHEMEGQSGLATLLALAYRVIRVCENIQVVYVKFSSNRHIIDDIVEAHCCVVITSELILMSKDVAESINQTTDCRTFWPHRPYMT